jgi:predicted Ser/Thr protein kinase
LRPLGPFVPSEFGRSPFTLLREDIQDKVLSIVRSSVEDFVGYKLKEWRNPDQKAAEIVDAIFKHYYPGITTGEMEISDLSQEDYLRTLEKHVRIVRRKRDYKRKPSNIVRFVPENPNYEQLFVSENIRLKPFYPVSSALAYDFSGIVSQQDGGALIFDEFPRNDVNLLNTNLEIAQNGVVQAGIGPAYELDTFTLLTANDESVDDAREKAAIKALMDRTHTIPTRHLLHPYQIAKAFLYTYGKAQFLMKKLFLSEAEKAEMKETKSSMVSKIEPLELNTVYPNQDANGKLLGVDGRYSVYYRYDNSRNILVSPHTLEMLGLVVSSTRLVTDVNAMATHWSEMQVLSPSSHLYTSAKSRLKVIMGEINPEDEIRKDLFRVRYLMREGEKGISHRDIESWFKTALELTVQKKRTALTPMILDEAFKSIFDKETVKPDNKNLRAAWLNRYRMVKTEFIMPALFKDIRKIVSGDGEKAERIYDQIVREIITLSQNPDAEEWMPEDGSSPQPIKDKRLKEVKQKFKDIHNFEFSDSFLLRHLGGASSGKGITRNQELLDAIQAWLVETDADVADMANQIASYYEGRVQDPKIERMVREAEDRMGAYGYDAQSFSEAIIFWKKLVYESTRNKGSN